jgi:hypothetical protein
MMNNLEADFLKFRQARDKAIEERTARDKTIEERAAMKSVELTGSMTTNTNNQNISVTNDADVVVQLSHRDYVTFITFMVIVILLLIIHYFLLNRIAK